MKVHPTPSGRVRAALLAALVLGVLGPGSAAAQFTDQTPLFPGTERTNGVSWVDYDGDGDLDVYTAADNSSITSTLFRNDGVTGFTAMDIPALADSATSTMCGIWGDYDNDGDQDVFLGRRSAAGSILRNDGGDVFTPLGGFSSNTSAWSAAWADYDNDGDIDLYAACWNGGQLWRNDGSDTFTNVTSGVFGAAVWGIVWGDYNNDGFVDAFLGGQGGTNNALMRNDGDGTFTNVITGPMLLNGEYSIGNDFGDYDNDGDLDLHIGNFTGTNQLWRNDGNDTWVNVTTAPINISSASTYDGGFGDYDNDGDLDLRTSGDNVGIQLFRNDGNDTWTEETALVDPRSGSVWCAGYGDYNADGWIDLCVGQIAAINASNADSTGTRVYRNDNANGNHWFHVDLVGSASSRDGIGARIEIAERSLSHVREVTGGGEGTGNQNSLTAEFGLGGNNSVADMTIRWPSGVIQRRQVIPADQVLTVWEAFEPAPAPYAIGNAVNVTVELSSAIASSPILAYRIAGSTAAFDSLAMAHANDVASATVPANRATDRGIEAHVVWTNPAGTTTSMPMFIPATLPAQALPTIPAPEQHLLFGFPFRPTNSTPAAAVEDELGAPDNTKWRLGRWNHAAGRYLEHPGDGLTMGAGSGFWLIQRNPVAVSSPGQPVSTVGGFALLLDPGWTMIAHPYLFPVAFANLDLTQAPNVEGRLVGFTNGYANETVLAPWRGYWMRNNGPTAETVIVPGAESVPQPAPPAQLAAGDWRLEVSARQGVMTDLENVLGVSAEATDEPDRLDFHEPPAFPGVVRVYFENPDAGSAIHELSQDLRPEGADGNAWDLVIDAPEGDPVHVSFQGVAAIDEAQAVWLITEDTWAVTDLRERAELTLPSGRTHRFRLVVGSETFAESVSAGQDRLPVAFALGASYPNPFASTTSFSLALPREASVELTVYDVTGRRVRTLHSGALSAGRHTVSWNATDESGSRVAPGVYFAKMSSDGFTGSQKVVLLQ